MVICLNLLSSTEFFSSQVLESDTDKMLLQKLSDLHLFAWLLYEAAPGCCMLMHPWQMTMCLALCVQVGMEPKLLLLDLYTFS